MKVFFVVTAMVLAGFCLPTRAEMADAINAIVNDKVITFQEVLDFTQPAIEVLRQEYADQPDLFDQKYHDTLADGLETLVENQLILNEFAANAKPLPDSLVDEWVNDTIRERFGDRITCIKTLQAQGETFEKFRQDIRDQQVIMAMRSQKLSEDKIIISPYKIETYYQQHQDDFEVGDEVKLRMIVLNKNSEDDPDTRQRADEILSDLKSGASFQQLESLYSQDTQQQGSDWMECSVLRKELAAAVTTLKPGQTSGVIETSDDCYILRVEDKRPAHVKPLNDVRDGIEKTLRAQEEKRIEQRWIDSLKKKAYIQFF